MRIKKFDKSKALGALSVFLFFLVWEGAGRFGFVDPVFISYPTKVFKEAQSLLGSGTLNPHIIASLKALAGGFSLALLVGIIGGLIIGSSNNLYNFLRPLIFSFNALPKITIIPLVMIWVGIGISSKVIIVFFMTVMPILINTISGVRDADKDLLKMSKSFGADKLTVLRSVVFFSVLPFIFSAIKISSGRGITGLIVSEAFGYGKGLGYLALFYGRNLQTSRLMVIILLLLIFNLAVIWLFGFLEKKIVKWKA